MEKSEINTNRLDRNELPCILDMLCYVSKFTCESIKILHNLEGKDSVNERYICSLDKLVP
ncbi:hypothetical protein CWI38_0331p0010 [Hamiltosporidium tvaerminnensis]|uniref:Uncharacterized protein n=1 Tax=Hamiltosporidium tvaerminnensis TaxID=1176355 RepID=A0A4Q9M0R6_9MICR|nr:hypothetical protein CWI38_0331p0010 [Hamiltosporidium tvaerminnensis]